MNAVHIAWEVLYLWSDVAIMNTDIHWFNQKTIGEWENYTFFTIWWEQQGYFKCNLGQHTYFPIQNSNQT